MKNDISPRARALLEDLAGLDCYCYEKGWVAACPDSKKKKENWCFPCRARDLLKSINKRLARKSA